VKNKIASLLAAMACLLMQPPGGFAAPVAAFDLDAAQKDLVDRLVLDRAATLAAAKKRADVREWDLLAQLEQRDKQLRQSLAQKRQSDAEATKTAGELRRVTTEREKLVGDLEARDSAFKTELAEYRRIIAALAASPSPERRQALARYADGDRIGAFPVLEELTRAEETAREKASKAKAAEEYRQLAVLAADMKDRGEKTTEAVLRLWRAAADRDPSDCWTWIFLCRLYEEAGRTREAAKAAAEALRVADTPRNKSVALNTLGDVQVATGDLAAARKSFEESLQIDRRLAEANPSSAAAQRDVSVSLNKLGDVQVAAGDLAAARKSFEESHQIRRRLAEANPGSAEAQRDVSVSLNKLGDVQVAAGDLAAARKSFEESHQIRRRLAEANPGSAEAQRDVSVSLERLGDVQVAAGDLAAARKSFEESHQILRRLAEANPGSAEAQRDVIVSMVKLTQFPGTGVTWHQIAGLLEAMDAKGTLAPRDRGILDLARKQAAAENDPQK
jgi:tetratricopeptide (TPR) repeat protein